MLLYQGYLVTSLWQSKQATSKSCLTSAGGLVSAKNGSMELISPSFLVGPKNWAITNTINKMISIFFNVFMFYIFRTLKVTNKPLTKEELYAGLDRMNASRENRQTYANMVLRDISLLPKLIDIVFLVDDKVSCRAAWVLEFVCKDYIYGIIPHLDIFTKNLHNIHLDSAIRPVAKICGFIAKNYYSKETNTFKRMLKPEHKELIIESCFDWMINENKVAAKAHAMETLFLFGQDEKWIHLELVQILERDFQHESPAFKARAKHILIKIKKSAKS